ncbi:hypothetical protein J0A71_08g16950 [Encephalitozoon cuniculi]|nr:hypothetical protein J0A71_08g16950 [Encephalitozoon cuniculi]
MGFTQPYSDLRSLRGESDAVVLFPMPSLKVHVGIGYLRNNILIELMIRVSCSSYYYFRQINTWKA